ADLVGLAVLEVEPQGPLVLAAKLLQRGAALLLGLRLLGDRVVDERPRAPGQSRLVLDVERHVYSHLYASGSSLYSVSHHAHNTAPSGFNVCQPSVPHGMSPASANSPTTALSASLSGSSRFSHVLFA